MADKGFYIRPSDIFQNVRRNDAGDPNLNETPEKAFAGIEGPSLFTETNRHLVYVDNTVVLCHNT